MFRRGTQIGLLHVKHYYGGLILETCRYLRDSYMDSLVDVDDWHVTRGVKYNTLCGL